jgi:REP element-mobilizing transposase RayT
MPSTYTSLYYHLVFSTKDRLPLISIDWDKRLHAYLGGMIRDLDGVALEINGIQDHLHLLVSLKPTLSDFMGKIKGRTSEWVHDEIKVKEFKWQDGYSAFTVSPTQLAGVRKYIRSQQEHHKKTTFKEEYLELLKKAGIKYDEKYLW